MKVIRAILRLLALLITASALCALSVWVFGRIVTDRWLYTQWLFWTPTPIVIAGIASLLVSSHMCTCLASVRSDAHNTDTPRTKPPKSIVRRARTIAWLVLGCVVFWMVFIDWHSHRRFLPTRTAHNKDKQLSIAYWNMATNRDDTPIGFVTTLDEDIVIVANAHGRVNWNAVVKESNQSWSITRAWPFTILSRVPTTRWAMTQLQLHGRLPNTPRDFVGPRSDQPKIDVGLAAFFEFEIPNEKETEDANTFIIWIMDLPSDVSLHKRAVAQQTRTQMDIFPGLVRYPDKPRKPIETPGFPAADVILGDFNIPRSSGSIDLIVDPSTYVGAYQSAGVGPCATFPQHFPLVHIDQIFVHKMHRVLSYRVVDPNAARHYGQRMRIERDASR